MDIKQTCLGCMHFDFSSGSPGYSEWTPGSDAVIRCDLGYWDYSDISLPERTVKLLPDPDKAYRFSLDFRLIVTLSQYCGKHEELATP